MALVTVRFQVILDKKTGGYVTISPDRQYPPFHLHPKLGRVMLRHDWREIYLTWEEKVPETEVTKLLAKETTWVIKCWAYDPWALVYEDEVHSSDTVISYYQGQCIIVAVRDEEVTYEMKVMVEEVPSSEGALEFEWNDIFDHHIVSSSHQPMTGMNIATFDSKGRFIDVILREFYDDCIGEGLVRRFAWRKEVLKGQAIPCYYVLLNDWSGHVSTGFPPSEFNDGEDYGVFTAEGSWIFGFLEKIGTRVIKRDKEQEHLFHLLAILFRAWMNSS